MSQARRGIAAVVLVGALTACSDDSETTRIAADDTVTTVEATRTTESTITTTTTVPPTTTTTVAPRPTTTVAPTTTTAAAAEQRDCNPSYPDVCIPSPPPDLDCAEVSYKDFRVTGSDPHGFDRDNDGVGCES